MTPAPAPRRRFVSLPEGATIAVTLTAEQVDLYVQEAIDRDIKAHVLRILDPHQIRAAARGIIAAWVHDTLGPVAPSGDVRTDIAAAVVAWLDARPGWVARQLRRGQSGGET